MNDNNIVLLLKAHTDGKFDPYDEVTRGIRVRM